MINLLYHDVIAPHAADSSGFPGAQAARYKLTKVEFDQHLSALAIRVRRAPVIASTVSELRSAADDDWLITFDDGGVSFISEIAGQLERRGWRGWFFITTDYIGQPSFCTADQLRELHQRGHVIGSHSCSHPERFSSCSREQLLDEWTRSCKVLSDIIGAPVTSGSVPGGFYSETVAETAIEAGIRVLFNSEPTTGKEQVHDCLVIGRYNVYQGMSAEDAVALLVSPFRRWRQWAFWEAKKLAKNWIGPVYKALRSRVLGRR